MNRPLWKWLLAVSLSLNIGMLAAVAYKLVRTAPESQAAHAQHVSLPEHLRLNAEQRERWLRIERDFLNDIAANWRDIRAHREALVHQIFSAAPDRAAIGAEQERIAALQDAQQRRVIAQLLAERDVLDEHQRMLLMNLLLTRYTQEATEEERLHRE